MRVALPLAMHSCMNDTPDHFGRWILKLRRRRRLSQRKLGEAVGSSQASVSRLEAEKTTPDMLGCSRGVHWPHEVPLQLIQRFPMRDALSSMTKLRSYAFCQNPFCERNKIDCGPDGGPKGVLAVWRALLGRSLR